MKKVLPFRGERLREARIAAGYDSARAFARKHKLNEITYSQHEQSRRNASADDLAYYAALLKVDAGWLSDENITEKNRSSKLPWQITLPVRGTVNGKTLRAAEAFAKKPKRTVRVPPIETDVPLDQQFVYRITAYNSVTPSRGVIEAICAPFTRETAHKGVSVIAAVRTPDCKFVLSTAEISKIRPEYFTLVTTDHRNVTATAEPRPKYLATILGRVLALHRSLK